MICKNQLGRRNLTDAQKTYLIGRQYEAQKMTVGSHAERGADGKYLKAQNELIGKEETQNKPLAKTENKTAQVIAHEHGICRETVKRAAKFSRGVDAAEKV